MKTFDVTYESRQTERIEAENEDEARALMEGLAERETLRNILTVVEVQTATAKGN